MHHPNQMYLLTLRFQQSQKILHYLLTLHYQMFLHYLLNLQFQMSQEHLEHLAYSLPMKI